MKVYICFRYYRDETWNDHELVHVYKDKKRAYRWAKRKDPYDWTRDVAEWNVE